MGRFDGWDLAIWGFVAYLAVTVLVRMMIRRRDQLTAEFRAEMQAEQQRQKRQAELAKQAVAAPPAKRA